MRLPRFRIWTLMIGIAFLALILTVIVQTVLLRRAALREELLRNEADAARYAALQDVQAIRAELERLHQAIREQDRSRSTAGQRTK
jgi:hypothetical protein